MAAAIRLTLTRRVMPTRLGRLTDITAPMTRYLGTIGEDRTLVSGLDSIRRGVLLAEEDRVAPAHLNERRTKRHPKSYS